MACFGSYKFRASLFSSINASKSRKWRVKKYQVKEIFYRYLKQKISRESYHEFIPEITSR